MSIEALVDISTTLGFILGACWIIFVFYLKSKWLRYVEDILEDGRRWFSLNIFLAGHGVLHYGTIFFSKFHAKRYGMADKRKLVPIYVQRLFIFSLCLCLLSGVLMFASPGIIHFFMISS
ncbi:hypothetical protein [Thalassomonas actiniarum]|uniref:Uncharacterized protein n=1 Tax=Thalassomonas actiniarum TaxID=485447 RepID=A0AAE9YQQ1_9GAMM|nr:hypothetical protein [Thalassomonas actiniarum]WDD98638.1 hypothetical protein SG35_025880 [Thalassomonas actiniarum]